MVCVVGYCVFQTYTLCTWKKINFKDSLIGNYICTFVSIKRSLLNIDQKCDFFLLNVGPNLMPFTCQVTFLGLEKSNSNIHVESRERKLIIEQDKQANLTLSPVSVRRLISEIKNSMIKLGKKEVKRQENQYMYNPITLHASTKLDYSSHALFISFFLCVSSVVK